MGTMTALTTGLFLLAAIAAAVSHDGSGSSADSAVSDTDEPLSVMPSYRDPTVAWKTYEDALSDEVICHDRIFKARERSGQLPLDRQPATDDEPILIWAVDRREDGCAVLVAKGTPDDIRPITQIEEQARLRPAG